MKHEIVSRFKEMPKDKSSWRVFWLGITTLTVGPFTGLVGVFLRRLLDPISYGPSAGNISGGMLGVLITLGLAITTVTLFIKKHKSGERSWVIWVGLIPASIIGVFWILFVTGELLFPH